MSWQQWLEINYSELAYWAKRWHTEEWAELLAFMALYLQKNWPKFSQIPDGVERIKFLQTWMKNNCRWWNSDFRKSIAVNNLPESEYYLNEPMDYHILKENSNKAKIQTTEEDHLVSAEDLTPLLKETIEDLHRRFEPEQVDKLLKLRVVYLGLPLDQKVLWDLYFTQMLSIRAVAEKINLPVSAVHKMILRLRKKIKSQC